MAKGKVPITSKGGDYQYLLVDFPTKEWFDKAYKRNNAEIRDKYWNVLVKRSQGATLEESGYIYTLSKERIRQIEAKFIRKVADHYWNQISDDLMQIEQMAVSSKKLRSFLETETQ
jgi:hypothetical protein